nr:hypothetical protein CFP56_56548 [Quercus suber]
MPAAHYPCLFQPSLVTTRRPCSSFTRSRWCSSRLQLMLVADHVVPFGLIVVVLVLVLVAQILRVAAPGEQVGRFLRRLLVLLLAVEIVFDSAELVAKFRSPLCGRGGDCSRPGKRCRCVRPIYGVVACLHISGPLSAALLVGPGARCRGWPPSSSKGPASRCLPPASHSLAVPRSAWGLAGGGGRLVEDSSLSFLTFISSQCPESVRTTVEVMEGRIGHDALNMSHLSRAARHKAQQEASSVYTLVGMQTGRQVLRRK